MGHCDRTSLGDLFPESRNYRTVASEDISEAGSDEPCASLDLALLYRKSERLDVDLRKALGASHDVRRVHSLVGRNHHHLLDIVLDAFVSDVPRSCDIHSHCLARILFHQRHMLVCGRMEHNLRAVLAEDVIKPRLLTHVSDHWDEVKVLEPFLKLEAEVMHRSLAVVEED